MDPERRTQALLFTLRPAPGGADELYHPGQVVPPGIYCDIERGRTIRLETPGLLPATCDGRVAAYTRRPPTWAEITAHARRN